MSNPLYNENNLIGRLYRYFSVYFETFSAPSAESLFLLVLSILAMESAGSIRSLYRHFLSGITQKSLNAFYYVCTYAKVDCHRFMGVTASIALKLVPGFLDTHPVFLCIDDTIVSKFGKKSENVSKLFDHAAHNGANYLNGHCFVSLMLCVPVWQGGKIVYLAVPLGYRMWQKKDGRKKLSKLELAASMVHQAMPALCQKKDVIILCDSWYAKKKLICVIDGYENLNMICNARYDSALYGLPPAPTGKKGRPRKRGRRLSIKDDFVLSDEKIDGYFIGVRRVLTNIFGEREVLAYVTATAKTAGSRRLFFSTRSPAGLQLSCAWFENPPLNQTGSGWMMYIPLFLYSFRWNIEVSYYEQKTFWSLCRYMVRSQKGIEVLVNLINIAYCAMKILPLQDGAFSQYTTESVQEFRFIISGKIREQIFYARFVEKAENCIKSKAVIDTLKQLVRQQGYHF